MANFQHAHTKGGGHLLPWWQMGTRDCSRHEKQGLAWACDAAQRREVHCSQTYECTLQSPDAARARTGLDACSAPSQQQPVFSEIARRPLAYLAVQPRPCCTSFNGRGWLTAVPRQQRACRKPGMRRARDINHRQHRRLQCAALTLGAAERRCAAKRSC